MEPDALRFKKLFNHLKEQMDQLIKVVSTISQIVNALEEVAPVWMDD